MRPLARSLSAEVDVPEMTDNVSTADRSAQAEELMERYLALHDLRFRAGDIEFLPESEDKAMREKVDARAQEVLRNADSILTRKIKTGWPRPAGR